MPRVQVRYSYALARKELLGAAAELHRSHRAFADVAQRVESIVTEVENDHRECPFFGDTRLRIERQFGLLLA
jgi:hypothetical protein